MTQASNFKLNFWKVSTLIVVIFLLLSLAVNVILYIKVINGKIYSQTLDSSVISSLVESVSAKEIYPLFFCPCCGRPLDKDNICCGLAKERIDYIDFLAQTALSKDEVILSYVKEYGLNSFVDKNKQEEFKEKLIAAAPSNRPIISLTPVSYDFGVISQKEGKVFTYFDLRNEGKSDLVIDKLETSCGCTFAAIVFEGKESPFFTMSGHGYENPEWKGVSIPSGGRAQLKVMYDPDAHKDFRGEAIREISVLSNDPIDFEKKVKIELNQID
ncbi:hypothetical protein LCGC14_0196890 [marine sediment metagenome]|uniref:DUF1573 domain-containing protein n=1 Tax=marine sediment metagenome TaxID=412755 RepID=A0A0F9UJR6_9ZZZZ